MPQGILWVSSRIVNPDGLSPDEFCAWYEDVHIQQVLALSGVPSAVRYEAMSPQPDEGAWSNEAPWLTVYEMPDIEFRETSEFKNLDGQSEPERELLEQVFKKARFDTRFYREMQVFENEWEEGVLGNILISAALEPPASQAADFDTWYREEHLDILSHAPGFIRTRRYELVCGTALDQFARSEPAISKYLALHEFEGDELPWMELVESASTEWAKKVLGSLVSEELGWYSFKREYPKEEWGGVGVGK